MTFDTAASVFASRASVIDATSKTFRLASLVTRELRPGEPERRAALLVEVLSETTTAPVADASVQAELVWALAALAIRHPDAARPATALCERLLLSAVATFEDRVLITGLIAAFDAIHAPKASVAALLDGVAADPRASDDIRAEALIASRKSSPTPSAEGVTMPSAAALPAAPGSIYLARLLAHIQPATVAEPSTPATRATPGAGVHTPSR